MRRLYPIALLLLCSPAAAGAQQFDRVGSSGVALEAIRPSLSNFSDQPLTTAAYYLSGHTRLRPGLQLVVELPAAYSNLGFADGAALGNPYVGVRLPRGVTAFSLGVRAPLASTSRSAVGIGLLTDIDRMEAFVRDVLTVRAGVATETAPRNGLVAGAHLAPTLWIRTGADGADPEVLLSYGLHGGYRSAATRITVRLAGRGLVTDRDASFSERTFHQLWLSTDFGAGRVRPGLYAGVPLEADLSDGMHVALGLTLQVRLRD